MASNASWRSQFDRIVADNRSGASDIALRAAQALIAYADQEQPTSIQEISAQISKTAQELIGHHPSMAGLLRIFNDIFTGLSEVETARLAVDQIRRISNEHIAWVEQANSLLVERTLEALPQTGVVMTISYSSAVAKSLLLANKHGYHHEVVCLESRPMMEGRELANFLGKHGINTLLVVDAALLSELDRANLVIVGADSMASQGIVNKVGTCLLTLGAMAANVPCYVVGDTNKIWPARVPLFQFPSHSADEVWARAPVSVKIKNLYFDLTPWSRIHASITERGVTAPADIVSASENIIVHSAISAIASTIPSKTA